MAKSLLEICLLSAAPQKTTPNSTQRSLIRRPSWHVGVYIPFNCVNYWVAAFPQELIKFPAAPNQRQLLQRGRGSPDLALPEIATMRFTAAEGPVFVLPNSTGKEKPISPKFSSCGQLKHGTKSCCRGLKGGLPFNCLPESGSTSLCQSTVPSMGKKT